MPDKTEDISSGNDGPLVRFSRLVGEGNLYAPQIFSQEEVDTIAFMVGHAGLQIDLDCPGCRSQSTFQLPPVKTDGLNVFDPYKPPSPGIVPIEPKGISTIA